MKVRARLPEHFWRLIIGKAGFFPAFFLAKRNLHHRGPLRVQRSMQGEWDALLSAGVFRDCADSGRSGVGSIASASAGITQVLFFVCVVPGGCFSRSDSFAGPDQSPLSWQTVALLLAEPECSLHGDRDEYQSCRLLCPMNCCQSSCGPYPPACGSMVFAFFISKLTTASTSPKIFP